MAHPEPTVKGYMEVWHGDVMLDRHDRWTEVCKTVTAFLVANPKAKLVVKQPNIEWVWDASGVVPRPAEPTTDGGEWPEIPEEPPAERTTRPRFLRSWLAPREDSDGDKALFGGEDFSVDPFDDALWQTGHDHHQKVGSVFIPGLGESSRWVHELEDRTLGALAALAAQFGKTESHKIGGTMRVDERRLILSAYEHYDADASQVATHGIADLVTGEFSGFKRLAVAHPALLPRALGGYMARIPAHLQHLFGGAKFVTGQSGVAILSNSSSGPSLATLDPNLVEPCRPLVCYPHGLGFEAVPGLGYNKTSRICGVHMHGQFCDFIGHHGYGRVEYGKIGDVLEDGYVIHDPVLTGGRGYKGYPYGIRIWRYLVEDMSRVFRGQVEPWQIAPVELIDDAFPELDDHSTPFGDTLLSGACGHGKIKYLKHKSGSGDVRIYEYEEAA